MSLEFLSAGAAAADAVARSPMERQARAAGAQLEVRDGWNVAISIRLARAGATRVREHGRVGRRLAPGQARAPGSRHHQARRARARARATRRDGAWWCPLTPDRALVIGERPERIPDETSVVDVGTVFAAMTLVGPLAREVFARFCAADLRPKVTPVDRPAAGLDCAPAGPDRVRGRRPLPVPVRLGGRPVHVDGRRGRRRAPRRTARGPRHAGFAGSAPSGGSCACLKYSEKRGCGGASATSRGPTTS